MPPVTCHKKRVAKFLASDWIMGGDQMLPSHSPEYIFDGLYSWQEADYDIEQISLRVLRVPRQLLGDWGCGNPAFRFTVPSLWISIRLGSQIRGGHPNHDSQLAAWSQSDLSWSQSDKMSPSYNVILIRIPLQSWCLVQCKDTTHFCNCLLSCGGCWAILF